MSRTGVLKIQSGIKYERIELILANNPKVDVDLERLLEMGLCICHNELSELETIEYVNSFAQECVKVPL